VSCTIFTRKACNESRRNLRIWDLAVQNDTACLKSQLLRTLSFLHRVEHEDQIKDVLDLCYRSLQAVGSGMLADGRLLDLIRRVEIFGLSLLKMDLRQESSRHTELLCEICTALDLGNYLEWPEEKRCKWLVRSSCTCH
jgi:phosphoenolpyruvate carboxylase